jgi:hypothetical protein
MIPPSYFSHVKTIALMWRRDGFPNTLWECTLAWNDLWPNMGKCVPHSFSNAHWCHLGLLKLNSQLYWNMFSNMNFFHVGWWKIRTWVPMCKHVFPNGTNNVTEAPHISAIVATLALGSRPRQGLARLWAKREAWESHLMFPWV